MLSIGDLSRRTGTKIPTIRYYEQIGLIEAPERSPGNQRRYAKSALERLSFVRHARALGLPLDAIRDLIRLSENPAMPCSDAHEIAASHLTSTRKRIAQLRRLEKELTRIASVCDADQIGDCNVIRALADHELCESEH